MIKEVEDYIVTQRVCVLAIEMPDGSPHAATVHFAHTKDPFSIVIQTSPESRKGMVFAGKDIVRASVVVGLIEIAGGKEKTLQLDGVATHLNSDNAAVKMYLEKFPEKAGKWASDIFLVFTPTWWRFTDWSRPEGKTIYTPDGEVIVKKRAA
jgi:uncharacterized protein YhbP (UPF0306 family)